MSSTYTGKPASHLAQIQRDASAQAEANTLGSSGVQRPQHPQRHWETSENRFAALAQATGQMVWTTPFASGSVVSAPPWRAFTGQTARQVCGWGWLDAVHPGDRARVERSWAQATATLSPFASEFRARRHDGAYRDVAMRCVPVLDADGSVSEWVSAAADITARHQLEEALAERQREQTALLESISDGFLAVDKTGLLTYVNSRVEQVLGKRRDQLVGHNVRELFPEELAAPFYHAYEKVLADGTPAMFEAFYPPVGMWFETRLYPSAGGVTAYLNDSTSRKQMEEQLAQALACEQAAHLEAQRRRDEAEAARIAVETASQQLLHLQQVTDTALSHLALADLAPAVLGRICAVMAVDGAAILLLTEDGSALTIYASQGAFDKNARIPLGQGIAGRIAASRQPFIIDDLAKIHDVRAVLRERLSSMAGVPLMVEGRCIGVLEVGSAHKRQFGQSDVHLLKLVADRIALAIDHVQLYELARAGYAEAEARASELAATLAAMTDGVFVADRQGRRVRSNLAFRQLLGLDPRPDAPEIPAPERSAFVDMRDAQGQPVPPERLPTARILDGEVLAGPSAVDVTLRAPDGRFVEANVTGAPVRTTEGGIVGAVAVYRDVTERRKMERRTRESLHSLLGMAQVLVEADGTAGTSTPSDTSVVIARMAELSRNLLDCARICFMALDPQTEQLQPLYCAGWPVEDERQWRAQGRQFRLQDIAPAAVIERLRAGEVEVHEAHTIALPGCQELGGGKMLLAPLRSGMHLIGLLGLDFGEQAHQYTSEERVLAGAVAQLSAVVIERERLVREREEAHGAELASREATRRMELFMAMAGHEFRTPLTVVKGYLQMAENYLGSRLPDVEIAAPLARTLQSTRGALAEAQQASVRLVGLLDDLLQVSRAQAGKLSMRPEPCDLLRIVRDIVDEQRQMCSPRQITLRPAARRRIPIVADSQRIGQVVTNYLTNALKYSPADQPVEVHVQLRGHTAHVSVRDHGPGLPAAEQEAIWSRFYQAPGVQRQVGSDEGLGLGLYVCRTIIEQHGGQVGVVSAVCTGSTFWFSLSLAADSP